MILDEHDAQLLITYGGGVPRVMSDHPDFDRLQELRAGGYLGSFLSMEGTSYHLSLRGRLFLDTTYTEEVTDAAI